MPTVHPAYTMGTSLMGMCLAHVASSCTVPRQLSDFANIEVPAHETCEGDARFLCFVKRLACCLWVMTGPSASMLVHLAPVPAVPQSSFGITVLCTAVHLNFSAAHNQEQQAACWLYCLFDFWSELLWPACC